MSEMKRFWVVKDQEGGLCVAPASAQIIFEETEQEAKDRARTYGWGAHAWDDLENAGYRCVQVELTEVGEIDALKEENAQLRKRLQEEREAAADNERDARNAIWETEQRAKEAHEDLRDSLMERYGD